MPGRGLVLVLSLVCQEAMAADTPTAAAPVVIRAGTLIDGTSSSPKPNQMIVVRGGRVESVGPAAGAVLAGRR